MPGGVVSAARPVRGGLFFCRLVELWGGSSIEIAPGDDLGPFGHPDHLAKGARCRQEPAETANRYAVGAAAVERMVAVDHPGSAGAFCRRDIHGCAESPEKQTEGDAQHRGQDRATVENGAPLWAAARKAELS